MTTPEILNLALALATRAAGAKRLLHAAGMTAQGDAGRRQALAFLLQDEARRPAARARRGNPVADPA